MTEERSTELTTAIADFTYLALDFICLLHTATNQKLKSVLTGKGHVYYYSEGEMLSSTCLECYFWFLSPQLQMFELCCYVEEEDMLALWASWAVVQPQLQKKEM